MSQFPKAKRMSLQIHLAHLKIIIIIIFIFYFIFFFRIFSMKNSLNLASSMESVYFQWWKIPFHHHHCLYIKVPHQMLNKHLKNVSKPLKIPRSKIFLIKPKMNAMLEPCVSRLSLVFMLLSTFTLSRHAKKLGRKCLEISPSMVNQWR